MRKTLKCQADRLNAHSVTNGPWRRRVLCLLLTLGMAIPMAGCTRAFFRKQADREVADILREKDKYPEWKIEQYHVNADPRARFAHPEANVDRPAMPPDDEAVYAQSPHPQRPGHAGVTGTNNTAYLDMIAAWDSENRAAREAAGSLVPAGAAAPTTDADDQRAGAIQVLVDGTLSQQRGFLLTLPQAVELGTINSRTYQSFREDLYLAALPVTQQRFTFAWQWAAVENAVRQWAGGQSLVGQQNNWTLGSTASVGKLFSTGALLTMSFANSTVFNFLGNNNGLSSTSTVNVNMIQPLLQGGGKAVTLEPLTQAERNLFYSIRAYARFREQFYSYIMLGSSPPSSLPAAAGTSGGGSGPISVLAALGIASTDVSGQFLAYYPTLYRQVDLAADKKYVLDLEKALLLYEGLLEGGQVAPLQVDQVRSTLLQGRSTLLTDTQFVNNALDQFKLQLGMPVNTPLILDDAPIRPVTRQYDRYYEVLSQSDAATKLVEQQEILPAEKLRPFLLQLYTENALVARTEFRAKLPLSWSAWAKASDNDLKGRLDVLAKEHRKLLDRKTDLEMAGKELSADDQRQLREGDFEADLGSLEQILRRYETRPWEKLEKEDQRRQDRTKHFRLVSYAAEIVLVWARTSALGMLASSGPRWPRRPSRTSIC